MHSYRFFVPLKTYTTSEKISGSTIGKLLQLICYENSASNNHIVTKSQHRIKELRSLRYCYYQYSNTTCSKRISDHEGKHHEMVQPVKQRIISGNELSASFSDFIKLTFFPTTNLSEEATRIKIIQRIE